VLQQERDVVQPSKHLEGTMLGSLDEVPKVMLVVIDDADENSRLADTLEVWLSRTTWSTGSTVMTTREPPAGIAHTLEGRVLGAMGVDLCVCKGYGAAEVENDMVDVEHGGIAYTLGVCILDAMRGAMCVCERYGAVEVEIDVFDDVDGERGGERTDGNGEELTEILVVVIGDNEQDGRDNEQDGWDSGRQPAE
ncbi:hypothetical protein BDN72DRAFT_919358, partial [Pluteus cervinus]